MLLSPCPGSDSPWPNTAQTVISDCTPGQDVNSLSQHRGKLPPHAGAPAAGTGALPHRKLSWAGVEGVVGEVEVGLGCVLKWQRKLFQLLLERDARFYGAALNVIHQWVVPQKGNKFVSQFLCRCHQKQNSNSAENSVYVLHV